jgi:hypothetical protein
MVICSTQMVILPKVKTYQPLNPLKQGRFRILGLLGLHPWGNLKGLVMGVLSGYFNIAVENTYVTYCYIFIDTYL